MGASCGAVAFRLDAEEYDLSKIIADLFGNDFLASGGYCDSGKPDCIRIGKTKDFVVIINSDFANQFFGSNNTTAIQHYLTYFSNPDFVFAFEEYDSGGTYGYTLIYNGQVKRQFRSVSYNKEIDFGQPEPKELKWLNAPTITEDTGDGEKNILYKDPERDYTCSADELPRVMLQELMLQKLGFTTWNMFDLFSEHAQYQRQPLQAPITNGYASAHAGYNRPWWKFW
jgi:hypothetical protein